MNNLLTKFKKIIFSFRPEKRTTWTLFGVSLAATFLSGFIPILRPHSFVLFLFGVLFSVMMLLIFLILNEVESQARELASKMTRELKGTQNFLESLIENLPIMVFVKNAADLTFVRCNREAERLMGYKREDVIGKSDYDFFPEEQADFFTSKDRAVLKVGGVFDIPEEPIYNGKGESLILHTRKIPIFDEKGTPQYLLGISEDVTARKKLEQVERADSMITNLLVQDKNPDTVLREAVDIICGTMAFDVTALWMVDDARETIYCDHIYTANRNVARTFEIATRQAVYLRGQGLPGRAWKTGEPEGSAHLTRSDNDLHSMAAHVAGFQMACAVPVRVRGEVYAVMEFFRSTKQPKEDALLRFLGSIGHTVGLYLERSLREKQLNDAQKELAGECARAMEAHRARNIFLADMSRELRMPLNAIGGCVGTLIEQMEKSGNLENITALKKIQGAALHLMALVDTIFDQTKQQNSGDPAGLAGLTSGSTNL